MHTFLDSYSCIGSSDVPCVILPIHWLSVGVWFFFWGGGKETEGCLFGWNLMNMMRDNQNPSNQKMVASGSGFKSHLGS